MVTARSRWLAIFVAIPTTPDAPQGPTGMVANTNTASFVVGTQAARFLFANLNGTIAAWTPGSLTATIRVSTPQSVYAGPAINTAGTRLYAANDAAAQDRRLRQPLRADVDRHLQLRERRDQRFRSADGRRADRSRSTSAPATRPEGSGE